MDFSAEYGMGINELGLSNNDFWSMTPAELLIKAEGYKRKQKEKYNDLIYLAWHTEAFARTEKLPSLDSLMREKHEQTDEEMMAMAKVLNAAFGGEVVEA